MKADESARVFIGMGSNLGDSVATLQMAWEALKGEKDIHCVQLSSPYVSAPVDMYSQHWFTNAVGELRTALSPHELLHKLLEIETSLGRVREEGAFGYRDREIDLDVLYYGEQQIDDPELILPHPHLHDRLFVLSPIAEIAPEFVDCKRSKTVKELESRLLAKVKEGKERKQEIGKSQWPEE